MQTFFNIIIVLFKAPKNNKEPETVVNHPRTTSLWYSRMFNELWTTVTRSEKNLKTRLINIFLKIIII